MLHERPSKLFFLNSGQRVGREDTLVSSVCGWEESTPPPRSEGHSIASHLSPHAIPAATLLVKHWITRLRKRATAATLGILTDSTKSSIILATYPVNLLTGALLSNHTGIWRLGVRLCCRSHEAPHIFDFGCFRTQKIAQHHQGSTRSVQEQVLVATHCVDHQPIVQDLAQPTSSSHVSVLWVDSKGVE